MTTTRTGKARLTYGREVCQRTLTRTPMTAVMVCSCGRLARECNGFYLPELRVLTLWQPWASLMAWREKLNETRPKKWGYRGWVAIHASERSCQVVDQANESYLTLALDRNKAPKPWHLPRGKILAVGRFTGCFPTPPDVPVLTDQERAFGNYGPGRFYYPTADLAALPTPIAWKGGQGLRIAPLELRQQIADQLNGR